MFVRMWSHANSHTTLVDVEPSGEQFGNFFYKDTCPMNQQFYSYSILFSLPRRNENKYPQKRPIQREVHSILLFIIPKNYKLSKCPSTSEQMIKL